jgi:hypothetical protein
MNNKYIVYTMLFVMMASVLAMPAMAEHPASPEGCNADESVVNIARSTAAAEVGETIIYSVTAGNPDLGPDIGCDIEDRYITLILPDGTEEVFGPFDFPANTPVSFIGEKEYIADIDDLDPQWTGIVEWNGTLVDGFDNPSVGSKQLSVSNIPVFLNVTKTADPEIVENYEWEISKDVVPAEWHLFDGETGTSEYEITLTKSVESTDYSVSGEIEIYNPAQFADATIESVTDSITGVGDATVECEVTFPHILAPGDTLTCTYNSALPDDQTRTNEATVTTSGDVLGDSGTEEINFTGVVPLTGSFDEVTVEDDLYDLSGYGPFSESDSFTYTEVFSCEGAEYTEGVSQAMDTENTATIVETGDSDSALVTVTCYQLDVTKDAETEFDREWTWEIVKTGDETSLTLEEGETHTVNYEVVVTATSEDSNWYVSGSIVIDNPHPTRQAVLTQVVDDVDGTSMDVECTTLIVDALSFIECTYDGNLIDASGGTNTATATQQLYDFDEEEVPTESGTADYEGTAAVEFSDVPTNEIDECIDLTDSLYGDLGEACADESPKTFEYSFNVGGYEECGLYEVENIASFVTQDTESTGSDNWVVEIEVLCPELGCTLTRGYWQTHSIYGPAPYDETWAAIGEDTPFYLSGKTWYEAINTPPAGGNAYYQLAPQYIAAVLNIEAGASAPQEVLDAIDAAETLFETYTPEQIGALRGNNALRAEFIALAETLDDYNNGLIGPGHCDAVNNVA